MVVLVTIYFPNGGLNKGPFEVQTDLDHLNTRLQWGLEYLMHLEFQWQLSGQFFNDVRLSNGVPF